MRCAGALAGARGGGDRDCGGEDCVAGAGVWAAGRDGRGPAAIRLNYGIQRSENGGTAVRAVAMLPLITGPRTV